MRFTLFLLFVETAPSVGTQPYLTDLLLTISYMDPSNYPVKTPGQLFCPDLERLLYFCLQESISFSCLWIMVSFSLSF